MVAGFKLYTPRNPEIADDAANLLSIIYRACELSEIPAKNPKYKAAIPAPSSHSFKALEEILNILRKYAVDRNFVDALAREARAQLVADVREGPIPIRR